MLGGLQIRALQEQLVGSGEMTEREFHDTILKGGRMPIEMVRARLPGEAPPRVSGRNGGSTGIRCRDQPCCALHSSSSPASRSRFSAT